jgi:5-methylcytosine-specific restriction endonuclease McrA
MTNIPAALRREVIRRARGRCEYCGLAQAGEQATFHIDHIIPRTAGGATLSENLALACVSCSLRKGPRQTAVDPVTGEWVPLYHPRRQRWLQGAFPVASIHTDQRRESTRHTRHR